MYHGLQISTGSLTLYVPRTLQSRFVENSIVTDDLNGCAPKGSAIWLIHKSPRSGAARIIYIIQNLFPVFLLGIRVRVRLAWFVVSVTGLEAILAKG